MTTIDLTHPTAVSEGSAAATPRWDRRRVGLLLGLPGRVATLLLFHPTGEGNLVFPIIRDRSAPGRRCTWGWSSSFPSWPTPSAASRPASTTSRPGVAGCCSRSRPSCYGVYEAMVGIGTGALVAEVENLSGADHTVGAARAGRRLHAQPDVPHLRVQRLARPRRGRRRGQPRPAPCPCRQPNGARAPAAPRGAAHHHPRPAVRTGRTDVLRPRRARGPASAPGTDGPRVSARGSASLDAEHVGRDAERLVGGGHAGVHRGLHEDLDELLLGAAVVERAGQVAAQLAGLAEGGELGDGDQAAVAEREARAGSRSSRRRVSAT